LEEDFFGQFKKQAQTAKTSVPPEGETTSGKTKSESPGGCRTGRPTDRTTQNLKFRPGLILRQLMGCFLKGDISILDVFVKSSSAALLVNFGIAAYLWVRSILYFCIPCIGSFFRKHRLATF
jgi:hypothetical protein